jgi:hypothetical protein
MLLPTTASGEDAPPVGVAWTETRRELTEKFDGLTAYTRSPAKGVWTAPDGHAEHDDVVMVEIVTDTFEHAWWRMYAARLAARFGQKSIHVRAISIELLDEKP